MRILLLFLFLLTNLSFAQYHSKIFHSRINELSIYKANLQKADWPILDELTEAPVYNLYFDIKDEQTIDANAEILINNQEDSPLNKLYFHLYPNLLGGKMIIRQVRVSGKDSSFLLLSQNQTLKINLKHALLPHQSLLIEFDYQLKLPLDFERNYGLFTNRGNVLTLGHAYPTLAVYDDAGWHTETPPEYGDLLYADISFFHVKIVSPTNLITVASGTTVHSIKTIKKNYTELVAGPVRDFFLSASAEYRYLQYEYNGIKLRSYYLASRDKSSNDAAKFIAQKILDFAVQGLAVFEDKIGNYPYKRLNYVPIDTSALGIEFPETIAMSEDYYRNRHISEHLESTTIHELAHQWFYGVIGNDQLNQPWLDESMAQYATLLYFSKQYGALGKARFRTSLINRWQQENIVIGKAVADYTASEYYSLIYGRGPLLIEELSGILGATKFAKFLKVYYQKEKFRISSSLAFKEIAEDACGCNLDDFFQKYILP